MAYNRRYNGTERKPMTIDTSEQYFPHLGINVPMAPHKEAVFLGYKSPETQSCYNITSKTESGEFPKKVIRYEYDQHGNEGLDFLVAAMVEAMALREVIEPTDPRGLGILQGKVDAFLRKYADMSYDDLIKTACTKEIRTNDFAQISSPRIKRKLFDFRARIYLAALAASVKKGYDLPSLLQSLHDARILPIKKEITEPTFIYIEKVLGRGADKTYGS